MQAQNFFEVIDGLITLYEAAKMAKANDGKIDLNDAGLLVGFMVKAPNMISGIMEIEPEIRHLDEAGRAELVAAFKQRLDLEDDRVEELVEEGFDLVLKLVGFLHKL